MYMNNHDIAVYSKLLYESMFPSLSHNNIYVTDN